MQFIFLANSVYFDTESVISNNKATMLTDKACFFESIQDSLVFLYGTEITDNHAWKQAGVILADATTLIIWHAVFSGNSAGESTQFQALSGAIQVINHASMEIRSTSFIQNRAYTASAIYLSSNKEGNIIDDCKFQYNDGRGVIEVIGSALEIRNSTIDGNISEESPNIKATQSQITMDSNVFSNQTCTQACYLLIQTTSTFQDANSVFRDAKASLRDGVGIISGESIATFNNTQFIHNTAPTTANLGIENASEAKFSNTIFEDNSSKSGGSCIRSQGSSVSVMGSKFIDFADTAIVFVNSLTMLDVVDSEFNQGRSQTQLGGAIRVDDA